MRNIHPAAVAGIALSALTVWMMFRFLLNIDVHPYLQYLSPEEQERMSALIDILNDSQPVVYGLLVLQAIALALIYLRVPYGLGLASLAAVFMLPISLVYLVGSVLTFNMVKYAGLAKASVSQYPGAFYVYASAWTKKSRIGVIVFAFAVVGIWLLYQDFAMVFFAMGMVALYCAVRAARHHALAILRDTFIVSPALLAPLISVAYEDVREATLFEDRIIFDIMYSSGPVQLVWSLRNLEIQDRGQAIEELGAALDAHNVPLK